jgi:hypothetical protein
MFSFYVIWAVFIASSLYLPVLIGVGIHMLSKGFSAYIAPGAWVVFGVWACAGTYLFG